MCAETVCILSEFCTTVWNRWGQAAVLLNGKLYIHGGLSDPYNSYSYTSAPGTSDLLLLDLSTSFNASAPPWQFLAANSSPSLAWHTLSAFNTTDLLLFGGQPGPNSETVLTSLNDSAVILATSSGTTPTFVTMGENWAREPVRRMRHTASFREGKVWIVGGEKADGSGNAFSDHYIFDPSATQFTLLSSGPNSPPDIYGHASVVLPDQRLVVLGGYCASCTGLVPLNMVWSLNTTGSDPDWELLTVSNASLPNPRRDFAAVALPNGNILIHGGGDAQLEHTYSDGWILDTSTSPMTWKNADVLSQIGQRKNHAAVLSGGLVLFSFGYGASAPASPSMLIYDPTSSVMVSWYSALSFSSSTMQPGDGPAPTGHSGSNSGPGSSGSQSSSAPSSVTSDPSTSGASDSGTSKSTILAIALGTTLGFLCLVAGIMTVRYVKRRHIGNAPADFVLIGGDFEDKSGYTGSGNGVVPIVGRHYAVGRGVGWSVVGSLSGVLAYLGIRLARVQHRPRRDMLADEDARSFTWGGRPRTTREGSESTSAWTLRSMGAVVRGVVSREPSASGTGGDHDDRLSCIGELDHEGLMDTEGDAHSERPLGLRGLSSSRSAYTNPFADPQPEDDYTELGLHPGMLERDEEYDRPISRDEPLEDYDLTSTPPSKVTSSINFPLRTLSPLREVTYSSASHLTSPPRSLFDISQDQPPASPSETRTPTSPTSPHALYITSLESFSRHSSLSKPHSPSLQPMRRSDSWWTRFSKTPLLDRRGSVTSPNHKPLDFRDPTPAPPLTAIEEAFTSSNSPNESRLRVEVQEVAPQTEKHARSVSSAYSMRTADTESAERLGGTYDVVQRAMSEASASRNTLASGTLETVETATSTVVVSEKKLGLLAVNRLSTATGDGSILSYKSSFVNSVSSLPSQTLATPDSSKVTTTATDARSRSPLRMPSTSSVGHDATSPTALTSPRSSGSPEVLSKIRAYERRLSQDRESQLPSPPRNTRKREEVPSRSRPTIKYGLAPHAPLYVANPDVATETIS
ncbi:hypothetical protein ID866_8804 [Astraeus odoratus]|nr:hypothetical protein ID866_8804 [Astraeus odoratus]